MNNHIKKIKRALISVSDKSNIIALCQFLEQYDIEIISTGGTAKLLRQENIAVKDVSDVTNFPEIMDGRVKTLHPNIHGGILAMRDNPDHQEKLQTHHIPTIDLVIVNLYPFADAIANSDDHKYCIENIDIGGPAMIRAAAKNHHDVAIITHVDQYKSLQQQMKIYDGGSDLQQRQLWAQQAFAHTSQYDMMVQSWINKKLCAQELCAQELCTQYSPDVAISNNSPTSLRYGENPHQKAWLHVNDDTTPSIIKPSNLLQGKALSYNNINDGDAAFCLVSEFKDGYCCAIIKHANPSGVAMGKNARDAFERARACDPLSAFGGIVALNAMIDKELALLLVDLFLELVIAPKIDDEARKILQQKPNMRVIVTDGLRQYSDGETEMRSISGGMLIQECDQGVLPNDLQQCVVTEIKPNAQQIDDMIFAWKTCKHTKSNAIIYARDQQIVAVGAGQMSRLDSAQIAANKSAKYLGCADSVVASDAFFPFADGLQAVINAGALGVIQPGGSMRDDEVIKAANDAGIAMVMTNMRHFKH